MDSLGGGGRGPIKHGTGDVALTCKCSLRATETTVPRAAHFEIEGPRMGAYGEPVEKRNCRPIALNQMDSSGLI